MTRRIVLRVSVSPDRDADEIEAALSAETLRAAEELRALRTLPPPTIRFDEEEEGVRFTVTCTIGRMIDAEQAHRELAKRLRSRLRALGLDPRRIAIEYGLAWQEPARSSSTGDAV
jgi:hypothetical protein